MKFSSLETQHQTAVTGYILQKQEIIQHLEAELVRKSGNVAVSGLNHPYASKALTERTVI